MKDRKWEREESEKQTKNGLLLRFSEILIIKKW